MMRLWTAQLFSQNGGDRPTWAIIWSFRREVMEPYSGTSVNSR